MQEKERVEKWKCTLFERRKCDWDLGKIQCGIRETLSLHGIWLKYRAGSGIIIGIRDLAKIQTGIWETLSGHGIWLLPEQRDSIKYGNGCEIGKENDIGDVTEVQDPLFQTPSLGWQFYYNINIKSVSVKIVRAWNSTKQEENSQNHFHIQNNTYCLRETKLWEARFCKGRGS